VLITRLFGGGARAREIDEISWLRPSAAKSALRFWWRAAHAQEFSSLETLRERESFLFGAPATFDSAGRIHGGPGALEVTTQSHLGPPPVDYDEPLVSSLNYALFPAQPMGQPAAKVAPASDQTRADLKLRFALDDPSIHQVFLASLRLWLTLGGAGARSRRGAGALAVGTREEAKKLGLPQSRQELEAFLAEHCRPRPVPQSLDGVFCLARTRKVFVGPGEVSGEKAQKRLLSALKEARQDRPHPSAMIWGRSRWPEADAIRLQADPRRNWHHAPNPANANLYPRSVLGLPIVIHFKTPPAEPGDHHVLGALPDGRDWRKVERYSSPVLLRPVRVWEGNRTMYVPVAVFTDCTLPATARPLITRDPTANLNSAAVVASFEMLNEADETLRRIENVFETQGFHFL
jgi:CRISPR/Cas system CMR-associated protein Cmr1 (group 7 of RAMP superfamily)